MVHIFKGQSNNDYDKELLHNYRTTNVLCLQKKRTKTFVAMKKQQMCVGGNLLGTR